MAERFRIAPVLVLAAFLSIQLAFGQGGKSPDQSADTVVTAKSSRSAPKSASG
jgi:hypothetical protein